MSQLYREIQEQPDAFRHTLDANRVQVAELVAAVRRSDIRYVVLAGRGTSDNAATYAKYLLQIACSVPVALSAPSVHTLYEADVDYRGALVVGVSQSGAGEDIAEVIARARRTGGLTVAITNTDDSLLSRTAEHTLLCQAGVEKAVAATKTYTTTLALFALIAAEWSGRQELVDGLARIHEAAARALAADARVADLAQTLIHAERFLTVARGLHLSTAIEAGLKLAETTGIPAQPFSSADLLHGPIASVAAITPCLLFAPAGKTAADIHAVAERLRERNARVLLCEAGPEAALPLADPGTELLSPLVDILPAQLLAYHLTLARGMDPDNPKGLTKVTVTR